MPCQKAISLRLDADVLTWFKARSEKYRSGINEILCDYMRRHQYRPVCDFDWLPSCRRAAAIFFELFERGPMHPTGWHARQVSTGQAPS
jgi:hypothetical protein